MSIRKRMEACPVHRAPPEGFVLSEVEVRLAKPEERPLWDALMDQHHYLGFRRLAGMTRRLADDWLEAHGHRVRPFQRAVHRPPRQDERFSSRR